MNDLLRKLEIWNAITYPDEAVSPEHIKHNANQSVTSYQEIILLRGNN